jgi:hypothetical protein
MHDEEPVAVSRRLLRQAAAICDVSEPTAARALAGFSTRGPVRERLLEALESLGVDRAAIPPPFRAHKRSGEVSGS